MQPLRHRIRYGMATLAFLLTATAAPAQRVSLADLERQLAELEAQLARIEREPILDQDASTQPGLTITGATLLPQDASRNVLFLVGRNFGAIRNDAKVRLASPSAPGGAPVLEDSPSAGWSNTAVAALVPIGLPAIGYTVYVANRTPLPGEPGPILQTDNIHFALGVEGPKGLQGPADSKGASGPQASRASDGDRGDRGPTPGRRGPVHRAGHGNHQRRGGPRPLRPRPDADLCVGLWARRAAGEQLGPLRPARIDATGAGL